MTPLPGSLSSRRSSRTALLVVLVLVLGGVAGVSRLALQARADARDADDRVAVLQAARQQAVNLTSISHQKAATDIDRILAAATGELEQQFRREKPQLVELLTSTRSTSEGSALAAGIVSLDDRTAEVLVAADAAVTNAETQLAGTSGLVQRYRMSLTMRKVGDRWLAEKILFAGAPA